MDLMYWKMQIERNKDNPILSMQDHECSDCPVVNNGMYFPFSKSLSEQLPEVIKACKGNCKFQNIEW